MMAWRSASSTWSHTRRADTVRRSRRRSNSFFSGDSTFSSTTMLSQNGTAIFLRLKQENITVFLMKQCLWDNLRRIQRPFQGRTGEPLAPASPPDPLLHYLGSPDILPGPARAGSPCYQLMSSGGSFSEGEGFSTGWQACATNP